MESPTELDDVSPDPTDFFDALDVLSPEETLTLDSYDEASSNLSPLFSVRHRPSTGGGVISGSDREETHSTVTVSEASTETDNAVSSIDQRFESSDGSLLVSAAGFLVNAVFLQVNLIASFFAAPFRLLHFAFSLALDPLGTLNRSWTSVNERLSGVWNGLAERIGPVVGNHKDVGRLAARVALGCFWSGYVGFALFWIMVTAFVGGVLLMRLVVEELMHTLRDLSFDYTKPSPACRWLFL